MMVNGISFNNAANQGIAGANKVGCNPCTGCGACGKLKMNSNNQTLDIANSGNSNNFGELFKKLLSE